MPKKTRIIIIANGSFNNPNYYRGQTEDNDYVICADGGARYALMLGIRPDLVIGDLDSIEVNIYDELQNGHTKFMKFPSEKNESDLELAFLEAIKLKPKEIIVWGALGNRIDHLFGNLMLLTLPLKEGIRTKLIDEDHEIYVVNKEIEIMGEIGDYLSLFPLSSQVNGIATFGLKYKLDKESLFLGPTRGLSNEFLANKAKVTFEDGLLLVIHVKNRLTNLS